MKCHLLLSGVVATSLVTSAIHAQETNAPDRATPPSAADADRDTPAAPSRELQKPSDKPSNPGAAEDRAADGSSVTVVEHRRASEIIGMNIVNQQDETVGDVDDLAIDLSTGRVTAVVIASGGFLGIAQELSIVPPSALTLAEDGDAFSGNFTKDQLTNAPRFQGTEYPNLDDETYMRNVYTAYQAEPYFDSHRTDASDTAERGRRIIRATELLGMNVDNYQDETIGDINELILNQELDRVTSVVVSSGGFLGIGDTLSVLPVGAISITEDAVVVNATKETLEHSPRFTTDSWPERMNDPDYLVGVYDPYVFRGEADQTDAATDRDPTETQVQAATEARTKGRIKDETKERTRTTAGTLTAEDQSNEPGDLDATAKVRRKIVAHDDLSFAAKNIRVITHGGKVTLTGEVASEEEMETIVKIAQDELGESQVTNNLTVRE